MSKLISCICLSYLFALNSWSQSKSSDLSNGSGKDSVILYVPPNVGTGHKEQDMFIVNLGKLMRLPDMMHETKRDLNVRIWLWGSDNRFVVDIIKSKKKSGCRVISFNVKKKDFVNAVKDTNNYIFIHEDKKVVPKSGWRAFLRLCPSTEFRSYITEQFKIGKSQHSHMAPM